MDNEKSKIVDEVETLTLLGSHLLRQFDPETEYVKKLLDEEIKRLLASNIWKEKQNTETPWIRSLERGKYRLKIAIIHGRKGEHTTGADLVFELKDRKILFLQSKRVGSDNRLHFDRLQLKKIMDLETQINREYYSYAFPIPLELCPWVILRKTAFYHLIMKDRLQVELQERFFHVSEIASVLGSKKSVAQDEFLHAGIKEEEFHDMFWKCKIGGPDLKEETKKDALELYSLITNRMVIWLHIEPKP